MSVQKLKFVQTDAPELALIVIEKGVPYPDASIPRGGARKYPLNEMGVGDSFFVPTKDRSVGKRLSSSCVSFSRTRFPKRKFSVRLVKDGYRVWRVK